MTPEDVRCGLFRRTEIYPDHVEKYYNTENIESGESSNLDILYTNLNELGIFNEFGSKYNVLCPIDLQHSDYECIKMARATCKGYYPNSKEEDNSYISRTNQISESHKNAFAVGWKDELKEVVKTSLYNAAELGMSAEDVNTMANNFLDEMSEMWAENENLYIFLLEDAHGGNIGIYDGRIVFIDYGGVKGLFNNEYVGLFDAEEEEQRCDEADEAND